MTQDVLKMFSAHHTMMRHKALEHAFLPNVESSNQPHHSHLSCVFVGGSHAMQTQTV